MQVLIFAVKTMILFASLWSPEPGWEMYGFGGRDLLVGLWGHDKLYGGAGADYLIGAGGDDRAYGGSGDDRLEGGTGDDKLFGGKGNDYLDGSSGNNVLTGGDGWDTFAIHGDVVDGYTRVKDFNSARDSLKFENMTSEEWHEALSNAEQEISIVNGELHIETTVWVGDDYAIHFENVLLQSLVDANILA